MVVPGIMNTFISTFKDTSLVTIVSLYDLTGAGAAGPELAMPTGASSSSKASSLPAIYFVFCFSMSRYSLWVEKQVNKSKLR
jgi:general L-amino acid transport system permease protein